MVELAPEQLAELADMLAERLRGVLPDQPAPSATTGAGGGLVDAQTVADRLGVDRTWVYQHASDLGGKRIGQGERPRWRFDLETALAGWNRPAEACVRTQVVPRSRRSVPASTVPLLPIRGER